VRALARLEGWPLLSHPSRLAKGLAPQDDGPVQFQISKNREIDFENVVGCSAA
jgi:hypothetical protein